MLDSMAEVDFCTDEVPTLSRVRPHSKFSQADDDRLRMLVDKFGDSDWGVISAQMGARSQRQCRERWRNYLSPDLIHEAWTEAEDKQLLNKFREIGPKWHHITLSFPGRSRNNIHNRFVTLQRMEREKQGTPKTEVETAKMSHPGQLSRKNSPPARNQAALSLMDLVEEDYSVLWLTDPNSDFDSFF
jgi:hypothetical protein